MSFLNTMGGGQGHLKGGFLGFPKSGKTWTSALLAIGVRKQFGLDGPIAMFDTEGGGEYIAHSLIKPQTGLDLVGYRSRVLDDLIGMAREAESSGVAVLLVDSVTHLWRETCDAYLKQVNEVRTRSGRAPQRRLEFQDWNPIKQKWAVWTDLYLNSRLHIIICGRAGFEYDYEDREDGGKDLIKTGIKMKTESEFGFEPSLLVEMERVQARDGGKLGKGFSHRATVLGDRFGVIDGQQQDDPTFDFFRPHVDCLTPGAHAPIDTAARSDFGIGEDGTNDFDRERKLRVIVCEKVQAALTERWPGQSTAEKKAKVAALKEAFGTPSWTEVETRIKLLELKAGLERIEAMQPNNTEPATAAKKED
jgi:hypothetical protein